jgi:hypothetical protein
MMTKTAEGWRLGIPAGGSQHYRLSQLDDQAGVPRRAYPWRPPLGVSLRARVSSRSTPGTWGFGLWNDPYGFSFGPGDTFLRFPALPQAAWFFCASPKNYLSFRDDKPAHGFYAQVFQSPPFSTRVISAVMLLPFAPRTARRGLSRLIDEDSASIVSDPRQWHQYSIQWTTAHTAFGVDDVSVLETDLSPVAPLGMVIWIDNQYAAFDPRGALRWGVEANPDEVWLEIRDLVLTQ